jgi:hypothetical protein
MAHRQTWGEDRVLFVDDHGQVVSRPARWTGLAPPDPSVILAAGRCAFRVADLLEPAHLIGQARRADMPTRWTSVRRRCPEDPAATVQEILPQIVLARFGPTTPKSIEPRMLRSITPKRATS